MAAEDVDAGSGVLVSLGFVPLGELGIPHRWAFGPPEHLLHTSTYVVVDGCLSLRNYLAVREALRADAALRERYGAVKKRLARTAADIEEYGENGWCARYGTCWHATE